MLSSLWSVFLLMVALLLVAYIIEMLIKHGFFVSIKSNIHYFRLHTLEKINHVSTQINQTSDLAEQKNLLAQLKSLAKKYKEEQEAIVHPQKKWQVSEFLYLPRYRAIILIGIMFIFGEIVYLVFVFSEEKIYPFLELVDFINLLHKTVGDRGFSNLLLAIVGGIFGYFIWFYRDLNNYRERETSLRDVMFKEHKQLVEWATTEAKAENKKDKLEPSDSTGTQTTEINPPMIQVAGIYQLAPFLKDHHANLYQRSTLETLRAIVNAGRPKWDKWIKDYENWIIGHKQGDEPEKPQLTAAERAVHAVLRENPILFYHQHFNAKDFNLAGFDGTGLVLIGCDLQEAQLRGSNLTRAQFQGADLCKAQLQGSALGLAQFQCANLSTVNLMGANLINSRLQVVDLNCANLRGVNLGATYLEAADLRFADLRNIDTPFGLLSVNTVEFAIISEPKLEGSDDKRKSLQDLIQRGAISIANEQVNCWLQLSDINELKEARSVAIQALAEKGLTATTKASLEAEEANNV